MRGYTTVPVAERGTSAEPLRARLAATPGQRTFNLLAQGDSWFDYPPGTDLIDCLHSNHGHTITNIAVAGSTLNDEAWANELHPRNSGFSALADKIDAALQANI